MNIPELRKYQHEYVKETYAALNCVQRVMTIMPTGTGKTNVFSFMNRDLMHRKGYRVLNVAHRVELIEQIEERLRLFEVQGSLVGGGYKGDFDNPCQIAMIQSIDSSMPLNPDVIIVDEGHHIQASSYKRLLELYPKAHLMVFTATPVRLDGKGFRDVVDRDIQLYKLSWFFENNYLVRPKHLVGSNSSLFGNSIDVADGIARSSKEMRDNQITLDIVANYIKYLPQKQAVAFARNIKHSKELAEAFNARGISAAHLDGEMPKAQRKEIIRLFKARIIKVITNYDIVSEGFDVPGIEGILIGRDTESLSTFVQMVGRCLRPADGKQFGYVIDCVNIWLKHGLAGDNIVWNLDGAKKEDNELQSIIKEITKRKKDRKSKILQEIEGYDLIELTRDLAEIAMFHKFFFESRKKKRPIEEAITNYISYLLVHDKRLNPILVEYCIGFASEHGVWSKYDTWMTINEKLQKEFTDIMI